MYTSKFGRTVTLFAALALIVSFAAGAIAAGTHRSSAPAGAASYPVSPHYTYRPCGYYGGHPGCPNGSVTGTNKQSCKQNGEGCLRQK